MSFAASEQLSAAGAEPDAPAALTISAPLLSPGRLGAPALPLTAAPALEGGALLPALTVDWLAVLAPGRDCVPELAGEHAASIEKHTAIELRVTAPHLYEISIAPWLG